VTLLPIDNFPNLVLGYEQLEDLRPPREELRMDDKLFMAELPSPWERIREIAAKVGVQPIDGHCAGTISVMLRDGTTYDVWEIIARVLDRINAAVPSEPPASSQS